MAALIAGVSALVICRLAGKVSSLVKRQRAKNGRTKSRPSNRCTRTGRQYPNVSIGGRSVVGSTHWPQRQVDGRKGGQF